MATPSKVRRPRGHAHRVQEGLVTTPTESRRPWGHAHSPTLRPRPPSHGGQEGKVATPNRICREANRPLAAATSHPSRCSNSSARR